MQREKQSNTHSRSRFYVGTATLLATTFLTASALAGPLGGGVGGAVGGVGGAVGGAGGAVGGVGGAVGGVGSAIGGGSIGSGTATIGSDGSSSLLGGSFSADRNLSREVSPMVVAMQGRLLFARAPHKSDGLIGKPAQRRR